MSILIEEIQPAKISDTSLALGFFDGIHKGHKKVLQSAISLSKKLGTKSCVLTFKNHPIEILYGIKPEFITTYKERIAIFEDMGFDIIIMADFTKELANLSAEEYFKKILLNLSPKSISIGYNHKFGTNQSGDRYFLENFSQKFGFILDIIDMQRNKNEIISSTYIRNAIKIGDVEFAQKLLENPYTVENAVIHGAKRGRTINFPTANLEFPKNKIVPPFGVYAGYTKIDKKNLISIANIGLRPTFSDINEPLLEIHIVNFDEDIYGKNIKFEFVKKIRDEVKFFDINTLKSQIRKDLTEMSFFLKK